MSGIAVSVFLAFALLGMPLAFAIGVGTLSAMWWQGFRLEYIVSRMVYGVDSFPLMAIPLFMLAGQLMIRSGVVDPLIDFANAVVGRVRGGLGHVTVSTAMALSAVSGSAVADAAALGGTIGPPLSRAYSPGFAAALITAASCMGPIIPPSAAMIVYAVMVSDVSVAALFLAGVVPGIIIALSLMAVVSIIAYRRNYPHTGEPFNWPNVLRATRKVLFVLQMPVIVIGGIMIGAFTATEGAAIAVVDTMLIGFLVTRKLRIADIPMALVNAGIITAVVGALIAFSNGMTFLFSAERVGETVAQLITEWIHSPIWFVLVAMLALLILGMFIEGNSLIIMLAPILAPVAVSFGLDPVYFGFLFVMNVVLGTITPPVGVLLFVAAGIWRLDVLEIIKNIWPFIILLYAVLLVLVFFPELFMFLPKAFGYVK